MTIPPWLQNFVNTRVYHPLDLFFFSICFVCWVLAYLEIIYNVKKYKFVDMPIISATANIVWEFLWAFVFIINVGPAGVWGVRIWFFLDVIINCALLLYGKKQMVIPEFKKYSILIFLFLIVSWSGILYSFVYMKLDNGMGAVTAMITNVVMSVLYILMVFRKPDLWRISVRTAWYKFLGTGSITAISFHLTSFRSNYFLLCLGIIAGILDIYYIYLLSYLKTYKGAKVHSLQKRNAILKKAGFDPLDPNMPITVKSEDYLNMPLAKR
jgi:hypothetical protein